MIPRIAEPLASVDLNFIHASGNDRFYIYI